MRILQIAPPWFAVPPASYGGIEQVVASLADHLAEAGHDVTLLASGGSRSAARVRSVFAEPPSKLLGDPVIELTHVLDAYLDGGRYDVVHDHTLLGTALGAVQSDVPVVHTLHGPWTQHNRRLYARLAERIALVGISHDQAGRSGDIPVAGVVYNGIDLDRYPFSGRKDGHLAYVGRASREKGPEVAVQVARRLGRRLVMAIKINEQAEHEYWNRVVRPHVYDADIIVRTGVTHQEKVEIVGTASALLFPIQWPEPFGLVMVEANACGTPVVGYARGAAPEVVADGHTGRLVAPDDIDALCDAVADAERLDPEACRRRVEERFSSRHMAAGYQDVYAAAVAEGSRAVAGAGHAAGAAHRHGDR